MRLAVMTSGGDAPGMNPAVRAVVRWSLAYDHEPWLIREGYAGLLSGTDDTLKPAAWSDVSHTLPRGGTVLGTARCPGFMQPEGRRTAVETLVTAGLHRLVVIGGDGSLTGAGLLAKEWAEHLSVLQAEGRITADQAAACPELLLVGLVGSIDNDMCGTDMTIGCDTALHRVVEAIDALESTASSHRRAFVVEVMGRRAGYLALAAALCTEADHVLIPEDPSDDWRASLLADVHQGRESGRRASVVLIAEGAIDRHGTPIHATEVCEVLAKEGYESRTTVLGHVQRGGTPSAYDRVMSSLLGARAAEVVVEMAAGEAPVLLATAGETTVRRDLHTALAQTHAVGRALDATDFDQAANSRGPEFGELLSIRRAMQVPPPVAPPEPVPSPGTLRRPEQDSVLVVHVGAPSPGMNATLAALARLAARQGVRLLGAAEGLRGLASDAVHPLRPGRFVGLTGAGATTLGTNRWLPTTDSERGAVLRALDNHSVRGVVLIGGFEALDAASLIGSTGRAVAVVPATISNNVPGTERTIGSDTALGAILEAIDRLQTSAVGSRNRLFVVEVMGQRAGYLATAAGLGGGAKRVYTHERGLDLATLQADCTALNQAFDLGSHVGTILMADATSRAVDAHALAGLLAEESGGRFDTRVCVLGHTQQGSAPSPRDRLTGVRLASEALRHATHGLDAVVMGLRRGQITPVLLAHARAASDRDNRRPLTISYRDVRDIGEALSLRT